jgi:hypothetical protein
VVKKGEIKALATKIFLIIKNNDIGFQEKRQHFP